MMLKYFKINTIGYLYRTGEIKRCEFYFCRFILFAEISSNEITFQPIKGISIKNVISREELWIQAPRLNHTYILPLTLSKRLHTYRVIQEEK